MHTLMPNNVEKGNSAEFIKQQQLTFLIHKGFAFDCESFELGPEA